MFDVNTMKGSGATASTAGIESSANTKSVHSITITHKPQRGQCKTTFVTREKLSIGRLFIGRNVQPPLESRDETFAG